MPVIPKKPRNPLLEWADPNNDSVFDGVVERAAKKIVRNVGPYVGLEDTGLEPENVASQMTGPAGPMVAPLITIYKNRAAREQGTKAFREMAEQQLGKNSRMAANDFADRYPRVAAHMEPFLDTDWPNMVRYAGVYNEPGVVKRPMGVGFTKLGEDLADSGMDEATRTMFEEGSHAAQALGNRDMRELYELANRMVGYENNPFEVNAVRAAGLAVGETPFKFRSASQQLEDLANSTLERPTVGRMQQALTRRNPEDLSYIDQASPRVLEDTLNALALKRILDRRKR